MKKRLLILGALVLTAVPMPAWTGTRSTITVKGSDTLVILAQKWAEVYMGKKSDVKIQIGKKLTRGLGASSSPSASSQRFISPSTPTPRRSSPE